MHLPEYVTRAPQEGTRKRWALWWAQQGWAVFPLRSGAKTPLLRGRGVLDATTDPGVIEQWWTAHPDAGIGGSTAGLVVIDLDLQHMGAGEGAGSLDLLPPTRTHWSGRDNGNRHLVFRAEPNSLAAKIKPRNAVLGRGIDIKAGPGAYVVLPPTPHEHTNKEYWVDDAHEIATLTDEAVLALGLDGKRGLRMIKGGDSGNGDGPRMLSELLADPAPEGERNAWLTAVAGHYARQYRKMEDLYWTHLDQANRLMPTPLAQDEVRKVGESIWETEHQQHPERDLSSDSGWLVGNGRSLQVRTKTGSTSGLGEFADFDLICHGVALDQQQRRTYWLTIQANDGRQIEATIEGSILGDNRALSRWLAAFGISVNEPFDSYPKMSTATRLLRYLNHQDPKPVLMATVLGWSDELSGYVVPDGLITKDGLVPKEQAGLCASPKVVEEAMFHYGFSGSRDEALRTLAQVLTFQTSEVTTVFGAWWMATLVKEQIRKHTSLFPFVAVEASSGSGKTNGFFNQMNQLNGSIRGEGTMTRAVTRTIASLNRSGIAWIDDMDQIETVTEVLRAATSGGSMSKMGVDHRGAESIRLVGAVMVTGEHLGFATEKALADRSIAIEAPSPVDRKSQVKGREHLAQWEDVVALQKRWPAESGGLGLAAMSGWFLQIAAEMIAAGEVEQAIQDAKQDPMRRSGRNGDKDLVLLAGARLLARMLGEGHGNTLLGVHEWIARESAGTTEDGDNTLTLRILPRLLREVRFSQHVVQGGDRDRWRYTPVVIKPVGATRAARQIAMRWLEDGDRASIGANPDEFEIWYHISEVADCWATLQHGRIDQRTESLASLKQQTAALNTRRTSARVAGVPQSRPLMYRAITGALAAQVLRRALE